MTKRSRLTQEALVQFRWEVPEPGFMIVECPREVPAPDQDGLVEKDREEKTPRKQPGAKHLVSPYPPGTPGSRLLRYDPLRYNPIEKARTNSDPRSRLFLHFANLEPNEDDILGFANSCGLLVGEAMVVLPGRKEVFEGEPLSLWRREITAMRFATLLWYVILEGDKALLVRHVEVRENGASARLRFEQAGVWGKAGTLLWVKRSGGEGDAPAGRARPFTLETAAVAGIQKLVKERLETHVAASFLNQPDRESWLLGSPATRRLPLALRLVPKNLLGALWLQFAREIDKGVEYRRCAACERRMEISPEARRTNSRTCSARCRKKLERDRRDRAHVLSAEGKSARVIAHELGVSVDSVRKWTARPKRPRGRPRKQAAGRKAGRVIGD